jgi:hypothetical protein
MVCRRMRRRQRAEGNKKSKNDKKGKGSGLFAFFCAGCLFYFNPTFRCWAWFLKRVPTSEPISKIDIPGVAIQNAWEVEARIRGAQLCEIHPT